MDYRPCDDEGLGLEKIETSGPSFLFGRKAERHPAERNQVRIRYIHLKVRPVALNP